MRAHHTTPHGREHHDAREPLNASEVTIRAATPADAAAMVALLHAVALEGRWVGTEAPFDVVQRTQRLAEVMDAGRFIGIVAEARRVMIGQLTLRLLDGRGGLGMVVAAAERGRGIGRLLMEAAIAEARRRKLAAIDLAVFEHNAGAIALYRACGFVVIGAPTEHMRANGERYIAIPMTLDLTL